MRRILSSPKRKRRCPGRSCDRKFHRDARQDRVENISHEKETRSRPGSRAARNISAALYDGHFHKNALRKSGEAGADPGFTGLCESVPNRGDPGCSHALVIRKLIQNRNYERKSIAGNLPDRLTSPHEFRILANLSPRRLALVRHAYPRRGESHERS